MWCIVRTRIVVQPDKRLSEPELWSTNKIVRAEYPLNFPEPEELEVPLNFPKPEEQEF